MSNVAEHQTLELERFAYTPFGTFGRLTLPSGHQLYTIEDPWHDNRVGISCIPEGVYTCRPRPFHRGGYDAIHVTDVPDRSMILFHIANTHHDIRGCIGVGTHLGWYRGVWAVLNSRSGFGELMREMGEKTFDLVIMPYRPDSVSRLVLNTPPGRAPGTIAGKPLPK